VASIIPRDPGGADRAFRKLWGVFVRTILADRGVPKTSIGDNSTDPPTFWCDFPGGGIARIVVAPDRRVGLFSYVRRVIVIDLNFSPGLRG
jgi:hypothetical protein